MPVYNGERFLREAVESILTQSLTELELIVVDDGSTDATGRILAGHAQADSRVVVWSQANGGTAAARNEGIRRARTGFIAMMDADDVAPRDRLERQVSFLRAHAGVGAVGGAVTFVDERGRPFVEGVPYPRSDNEIRRALEEPAPLRQSTPFVHSAVLMRKKALEEAGGYRSPFAPAEDLDLWLRIADRHELANLRETVVHYRVHSSQTSLHRLEMQSLCTVAARLSATARREGRPDPFVGVQQIHVQALLSLGATEDDINETFVSLSTWLARTYARAGYTAVARSLFDDAEKHARRSASPDALAHVDRARARAPIGRRTTLGRLRSLLGRVR